MNVKIERGNCVRMYVVCVSACVGVYKRERERVSQGKILTESMEIGERELDRE